MQATAKRVMGGGFRRNSVSELKLKNRCTGSTNKICVEQGYSLLCKVKAVQTETKLLKWTNLPNKA